MAHLPKYEKVKQQLLAELRSGVYPAGERIPTREELVVRFGVTRTTVNQALKALVDCGVLSTSRRGGTVYTGQQPPRRVAVLCAGGRNSWAAEMPGERIEMALMGPLLFHASEFNLDFIDYRHCEISADFVERYDCVVAVMPDDRSFTALSAFSDQVLFINRYGAKLNFISTFHRSAIRHLVRENIAAAGAGAQLFCLATRKGNFVERERCAGFVDECGADQLFYRVCEAESSDYDAISALLETLPVEPGRPVVMCAPSMAFTGAVIQWARRRKLVFGSTLFYSDFDNRHVRRNTGEKISSTVQDFAAMGKLLYEALLHWGEQPVQQYVNCSYI